MLRDMSNKQLFQVEDKKQVLLCRVPGGFMVWERTTIKRKGREMWRVWDRVYDSRCGY